MSTPITTVTFSFYTTHLSFNTHHYGNLQFLHYALKCSVQLLPLGCRTMWSERSERSHARSSWSERKLLVSIVFLVSVVLLVFLVSAAFLVTAVSLVSAVLLVSAVSLVSAVLLVSAVFLVPVATQSVVRVNGLLLDVHAHTGSNLAGTLRTPGIPGILRTTGTLPSGHMHIGYACFYFSFVHFRLFPVFDLGLAHDCGPVM